MKKVLDIILRLSLLGMGILSFVPFFLDETDKKLAISFIHRNELPIIMLSFLPAYLYFSKMYNKYNGISQDKGNVREIPAEFAYGLVITMLTVFFYYGWIKALWLR